MNGHEGVRIRASRNDGAIAECDGGVGGAGHDDGGATFLEYAPQPHADLECRRSFIEASGAGGADGRMAGVHGDGETSERARRIDCRTAAQREDDRVVLPPHEIAVRRRAEVHGDARAIVGELRPLDRAHHRIGGRVVHDVRVAPDAVQRDRDGVVALLDEIRGAWTDGNDDVHAIRAAAHPHVRHGSPRNWRAGGEVLRVAGVDKDVEAVVESNPCEARFARDERHDRTGREEPLVGTPRCGTADDGDIGVRRSLAELHYADGIVANELRMQRIDARGERGNGVGTRVGLVLRFARHRVRRGGARGRAGKANAQGRAGGVRTPGRHYIVVRCGNGRIGDVRHEGAVIVDAGGDPVHREGRPTAAYRPEDEVRVAGGDLLVGRGVLNPYGKRAVHHWYVWQGRGDAGPAHDRNGGGRRHRRGTGAAAGECQDKRQRPCGAGVTNRCHAEKLTAGNGTARAVL